MSVPNETWWVLCLTVVAHAGHALFDVHEDVHEERAANGAANIWTPHPRAGH